MVISGTNCSIMDPPSLTSTSIASDPISPFVLSPWYLAPQQVQPHLVLLLFNRILKKRGAGSDRTVQKAHIEKMVAAAAAIRIGRRACIGKTWGKSETLARLSEVERDVRIGLERKRETDSHRDEGGLRPLLLGFFFFFPFNLLS